MVKNKIVFVTKNAQVSNVTGKVKNKAYRKTSQTATGYAESVPLCTMPPCKLSKSESKKRAVTRVILITS